MLVVLFISIQTLYIFCLLDGHLVSRVEKTKLHLILLICVALLSRLAVLGLTLRYWSRGCTLGCWKLFSFSVH